MAPHHIAACFILMFAFTESSKILIIAAHSTRSHYTLLSPIIQELANRKHDITVQAYYKLKQPFSNVKELTITQGSIANTKAMKDFFINTLKFGPIAQIRNFGKFRAKNCADYLNDETTKILVAAGNTFDLVLVDPFFADCPTAVASLVGKHIVNMYTSALYPWQYSPAPIPLSYVSNRNTLRTSEMSFFQRIENAIETLVVRLIYKYSIQRKNQDIISIFLPQAGKIEDIEKKVVFSITNADPVLNSPRPTVPNIVDCGGMHCRDPKPLPKDLDDFVESSGDDGFVIFGLGSNIRAEYVLSSEVLQHLLSAFSRLKQKVIWKFEAKLENVPKNVKVVEWMPQQDLLGHAKAKLFISHSGQLSLQEAIYHGVPTIGLPFFGDQRGNIARMQQLGIGLHFDFLNITADGLYEAITTLISDKRYYENMKKYSAIFKDQAEKPIDKAIYWIEYIIRHDGAHHFRSAAEDLNLLQYFIIDVVGFLFLAALTVFGIIVYLIKYTLRKFTNSKQSKTEMIKKRT